MLRRLKTYLRAQMAQERFSDLALIHIHYGLEIDVDDVLNRLIIKYPKRIKMKNILNEQTKDCFIHFAYCCVLLGTL